MKTRNMSWKRKGFILAFLAPTVIAFVLFYLYPIVTVFVTSFCKWDYTNITSPEFFGFADMWNNYKYIFELYPYFWEALRNSTIWALLGVFVQIPVSALIALAFSRKVKGVKFARNVYIIPSMISSAAMGMIFLQLYSPLYGVVNPGIRLFKQNFEGTGIYRHDMCLYLFYRNHYTDDPGKYYGSTGRCKRGSYAGRRQWSEAGLVYHYSHDQGYASYGIYPFGNSGLPAL